jgi:hypothetical protein
LDVFHRRSDQKIGRDTMPKVSPTYTRLTRPAASVASYHSLWLAADHLLVVTSTGYTEKYQRLMLRDIKGFFTIASNRRANWNLPWGAAALFSGIALVIALTSRGVPYVSGPIFSGALIALVWNNLLGAGCRTFVITGVQTAPLPALQRWPKTRKVLARLEPLILAAQADLVTASEGAATPSVPTASSPSP